MHPLLTVNERNLKEEEEDDLNCNSIEDHNWRIEQEL
jgi:hypothetical protein